MDYTDYEKLVHGVFSTEAGIKLLETLDDKFVNTAIMQEDGVIPSSIRAGKSDLVRQFKTIVKRLNTEQ